MSLSVLVADDNRDAAETLAMFLEMDGHSVSVVFDGQEAIDVAARQTIHLALLDLSMPSVDGYYAGQLIRGMHPKALLVAVSGHTQPIHRERTAAVGFDYHIAKPTNLEVIEAVVRQAREIEIAGDAPGIRPRILVRPRDGGPVMHLRMIADDQAHCVWFDEGDRKQGTFAWSGLAVADSEQRSWNGDAPAACENGKQSGS